MIKHNNRGNSGRIECFLCYMFYEMIIKNNGALCESIADDFVQF